MNSPIVLLAVLLAFVGVALSQDDSEEKHVTHSGIGHGDPDDSDMQYNVHAYPALDTQVTRPHRWDPSDDIVVTKPHRWDPDDDVQDSPPHDIIFVPPLSWDPDDDVQDMVHAYPARRRATRPSYGNLALRNNPDGVHYEPER
jgi:hypothetical protein